MMETMKETAILRDLTYFKVKLDILENFIYILTRKQNETKHYHNKQTEEDS